LTLGQIAGAGRDRHVVLAHSGVVDLGNRVALRVHDALDRLLLHGVEPCNVGRAVLANDARNPLGVVDLGNQVDDLTGDVAHRAGQIVHIVVGARVGLPLTRQNGLAGALVGGLPQT